MVEFVEVLKWVGIIFAAGFVGYFGKYLSKIIIRKFGKKSSSPDDSGKKDNSNDSSGMNKYEYKLEKKKLKSLKKNS